jgi:hypothetical protein
MEQKMNHHQKKIIDNMTQEELRVQIVRTQDKKIIDYIEYRIKLLDRSAALAENGEFKHGELS